MPNNADCTNCSILSTLTESVLFRGLDAQALAALATLATLKRVSQGEEVFAAGEPALGFFVVASGRIRVYVLSPEGKEQTLHSFSAGEPVGEAAVFAGLPYPAYAQAASEACLLYIPREGFARLIGQRPEVALNMLATLSQRLRAFARKIEDLSLKDVPGRLAGYLLEHATTDSDGHLCVNLKESKSLLATSLGTTPESLSRTLARLRAAGMIDVDRRKVTILQERQLADLADGSRI